MSDTKLAIEIKNLSKSYMIGHEKKATPGTVTFRDALAGIVRKPVELITGHKLKKEKFWALKDINLEIEQGDVVGIIGRNGSGKSTMLKVLSRIVEPTKGEIIMRGKVASLLEVGTGFHPELTGRENIYFNGSILGMKRKEIEAKFDEIVAFSEVEKFLDTPVKFYSSGMYVRLAFSVAAHLEPDILIVDEVLAVGDATFQKKCLGKMKDVAGQGRTVLFVSHSMGSIQSLCNKSIYIDRGQVKKIGLTPAVISEYLGGHINNNGIFQMVDRLREGEQDISVSKITLKNNGRSTSTFNTLDSLEVILSCSKNLSGYSNIQIDFNIFNERGEWLVCASGQPKVSGKDMIFFVDQPNLYRGNYSANISILNGKTLQDFLPECIRFTIQESPDMVLGVNGVVKGGISEQG